MYAVHLQYTDVYCSLTGSSVHGISQARILKWVTISYSNTDVYICVCLFPYQYPQNLSLFPLFPHLLAMRWWDQKPWSQMLLMLSSSHFHSPLSPSSRSSLDPPHFLPLEWYHLHISGCYFSQHSWFQLVILLAWHFAWCILHIS